jgi:hypothetical protein
MDGDVISIEKVIRAAPEAIVALRADPSRHATARARSGLPPRAPPAGRR